jgi:hypothetical protein
MSLKSYFIVLALLFSLLLLITGPALGARTMYLGVCHELVSQARSYEARADFHNQVAKALAMQIENVAKLPKNQGTVAQMDNLFNQYDENRVLERKFRELYRSVSAEADQCMKNAE